MDEKNGAKRKTEAIVGFEPTGHYWFTLGDHLQEKGYRLAIVNPFHVQRSRELDDNSPTKNDRKDPKTIAMLVKDGRYRDVYIPADLYSELREGQFDKETAQSLAKGQIRQKVPMIMEASSARLSTKERFLIRQSWNHLMFLEQSISEIDIQIDEILEPYREDVERIQTIPGMDKKSAAAVIGEIGIDIDRFTSERHLASWAGLSPGNNQSAGKKTPPGQLREILI